MDPVIPIIGVTSVSAVLGQLSALGSEELVVLGGGQIYQEMLPMATQLRLSRLHHAAQGSVMFPQVDWAEWELIDKQDHPGWTLEFHERRKL
jgi:dihydrofolate reductase